MPKLYVPGSEDPDFNPFDPTQGELTAATQVPLGDIPPALRKNVNVRQQTKRRYGLDWGVEIPEHIIHLQLWQRWREFPYNAANFLQNNPTEHFFEACRILFTEEQLVIHPWFERMAEAYTKHPVVILMGAASSGKSHFYGIALLLDYIASGDKGDLAAVMVSTSKEMLKQRSLAATVEYLGYLKSNKKYDIPYKYVDQKSSVVAEGLDEAGVTSAKYAIRGAAIREGSEVDAKAAVMGVHLTRVRSVADEFENFQDRAKVFLDAQSNLRVCRDYRMGLLFNPQGLGLPGCQVATPKNGWNSVNEAIDEWETKEGYKVLRFDGLRSPGVTDPVKYPFLPSEKTNAAILQANNGDVDSPGYLAMVRAFPSREYTTRKVITQSMVETYRMRDPVIWKGGVVRIAALDPAFTSGGDDCVFGTALVGHSREGILTLCIENIHYVPISGTSSVPVLEQIGSQVSELLEAERIPMSNFGCDDSGTQSVADFLILRRGPGLLRFNYQAKPPELPISIANGQTADKKYKNVITWLHYLVHEYSQYGQIRGLPERAVAELCERCLDPKCKGLLAVESKGEYKKRTKGRSPDTGDVVVMLAGVARQVLGFQPGATEWYPQGAILPNADVFAMDDYSVDIFRRTNNIDLDTERYRSV